MRIVPLKHTFLHTFTYFPLITLLTIILVISNNKTVNYSVFELWGNKS